MNMSIHGLSLNILCMHDNIYHSQIAYEPDEGLDEWQEKVFETQTRLPLLHWPTEAEKSYWSDIVSWHIVFI